MKIPDELYNVRFSQFFDVMKERYVLDENFKIICDAYCASVNKADSYKEKCRKNFRRRIKFENLSKELEEEILFYIVRNS